VKHLHETSDVNPRYVLYFAIALTLLAGVTLAGVWWMYRYFEGRPPETDFRPTLVDVPDVPLPEPRLQIAPPEEYQAQVRREMDILNSYGWVDREKGIARIPIDLAIEIAAQRGVK
jgi:hypothetical protein